MIVKGNLTTNRPLDSASVRLLNAISDTPRYARRVDMIGAQYGIEGEYYFQEEKESCILPYRPPATQPSFELNWFMNEEGTELFYKTDGEESIIYSASWLQYLISRFFQPKGILLNGSVQFIDKNQKVLELVLENNTISIE